MQARRRKRRSLPPQVQYFREKSRRWGVIPSRGLGEKKDGDIARWKPNLEMIKVCINNVTATGRLELEQRAYGTETDSEESSEDTMAEHEFDL